MYTLIIGSITITTRSAKKAYALYDQAVNDGKVVARFTFNTTDLRDR